jgi:hypothetical protein
LAPTVPRVQGAPLQPASPAPISGIQAIGASIDRALQDLGSDLESGHRERVALLRDRAVSEKGLELRKGFNDLQLEMQDVDPAEINTVFAEKRAALIESALDGVEDPTVQNWIASFDSIHGEATSFAVKKQGEVRLKEAAIGVLDADALVSRKAVQLAPIPQDAAMERDRYIASLQAAEARGDITPAQRVAREQLYERTLDLDAAATLQLENPDGLLAVTETKERFDAGLPSLNEVDRLELHNRAEAEISARMRKADSDADANLKDLQKENDRAVAELALTDPVAARELLKEKAPDMTAAAIRANGNQTSQTINKVIPNPSRVIDLQRLVALQGPDAVPELEKAYGELQIPYEMYSSMVDDATRPDPTGLVGPAIKDIMRGITGRDVFSEGTLATEDAVLAANAVSQFRREMAQVPPGDPNFSAQLDTTRDRIIAEYGKSRVSATSRLPIPKSAFAANKLRSMIKPEIVEAWLTEVSDAVLKPGLSEEDKRRLVAEERNLTAWLAAFQEDEAFAKARGSAK